MVKPNAQMPPEPKTPRTKAPPGAVDAHVHLVAGAGEFPLWDGRVENPAPGPDLDGWIALLREQMDMMGFSHAIIVHSILYGTDNSVTIEAIRRLGTGFKGVGLLGDDASDSEIDQFAAVGMVAVRLNFVHGGVLSWEGARAMAPALADRGLHIQMLCHMDQHMDAIAEDVRGLPVPVVFDHIAWPTGGLAPDGPGVDTLCGLLADGHAWVKLSALYRLCAAPYDAADALVARLVAANPERCLWGSDWPHLMLADAAMPDGATLLDAFHRVVQDDALRRRILVDNPRKLFDLPSNDIA